MRSKEIKARDDVTYSRTLKGLATGIYGSQKTRSGRRGHELPGYSKKQLVDWMVANGLEALYQRWASKDYPKDLKPSCDRLDDSKPYRLDNLRLTTWSENFKASCSAASKGRLIRGGSSKETLMMDLSGRPLAKFPSATAAAKAVKGLATSIVMAAKGKSKTAYGYTWEYL